MLMTKCKYVFLKKSEGILCIRVLYFIGKSAQNEIKHFCTYAKKSIVLFLSA